MKRGEERRGEEEGGEDRGECRKSKKEERVGEGKGWLLLKKSKFK